jgi:putative hemolysin
VRTALTALGLTVVFGVYLLVFGSLRPTGELMAAEPDFANVGWLALIGLVALLVLNGLFIGAETSIELLRSAHVRRRKDAGHEEQTRRLQKLIDGRPRFVAAMAFGSQVCRFLMFLLAVALGPWLAERLPSSLGSVGGLVVATLIFAIPILLLNLIVELVPKSYAALHPHRLGLALYRFIAVSAVLFSLPIRLVTGVAGLLTARFGGEASFALTNQAEEEIKTLVETAEETGEIESEEKELLHSVFEFSDTVVREVMTPRVDIDALPVECESGEVVALIEKSGHSRIPLYEGTDDAIVGIVHAKDLLRALAGSEPVMLRELMRKPMFVPENKNLNDLLKDLRQSRSQMAVVQDEFGGTSGIVTIEDIVEELVGDIVDEYDTEEPEIVEAGEGWMVDAKTHMDDVNHELGSHFESDEFDTIGGYVFGLFGRQPAANEKILSDGYEFEVAETDGRRILKLRVQKLPEPVEAEPSGA